MRYLLIVGHDETSVPIISACPFKQNILELVFWNALFHVFLCVVDVQKNYSGILLFLITLLGTCIRLWDISSIGLMNDELSAILRTQFNSISEVIEKGVKPDGHPALIQVFLYGWIQCFGNDTAVIKIPFLLMGIACIPLIYHLVKKWSNEQAGLITAVWMATLQYPVMYSQIARPYISGLFLTLVLMNYWTRLFKVYQFSKKNIIIYVLIFSLAAINHYFNLLLLGIIFILGLIFLDKKYYKKYLYIHFICLLIFLPWITIFIEQFSRGGVGTWLSKPTIAFIFNYFEYLVHYEWVVGLIGLGILIYSLINIQKLKIALVSLIIFLIVFIIGFLYSVFINPVLQFSTLIMVFPFLLFFVVNGWKQISKPYFLSLIILICVVDTYTLFAGRKHHYLMKHSPHDQLLKQIQEDADSNTLVLLYNNHSFTQYINRNQLLYKDLHDLNRPFLEWLQDTVSNNKFHRVILGALNSYPPEWVPILMKTFPVVEKKINYFTGEYYIFSEEGKSSNEILYKKLVNLTCSSHEQYSNNYQFNIDSVMTHRNQYIDIICKIESKDTLQSLQLVSEILSQDMKVLDWRSSNLIRQDNLNSLFIISLRMSDLKLYGKECQLKFYLMNQGYETFKIKETSIQVREGNPMVYGLYENF